VSDATADENKPDENKLIAERRAKLAVIREQAKAAGRPAFPNDYRRDVLASLLAAEYGEKPAEWFEANPVKVHVAGRMMSQRIMGKVSFAKLQDRTGQIQVFLQRDALVRRTSAFKKYDVGDILAATGTLFKTKTGELSVRADSLRMLTKSLRPLPDKWHGMADVDTRYRQRYVDLIVNEQSRKVFAIRNQVLRYLRDFLDSMGFMEVETPMLQSIPGGAAARPFKTHHNALDMDMYLRIAPELYLKRLHGRRLRARVRDQPQLPQRGRLDAAQPRVHDARAVRRVRRLTTTSS
jgi:lysyl-tRNA synthetase class 2